MQKSNQRALIAAIETEIKKLAALDPVVTVNLDVGKLKSSFSQLVDLLALGPEPKTRPCPKCGRLGMYNATVCGFCWTKTPPKSA
jgi:hypothetical protein